MTINKRLGLLKDLSIQPTTLILAENMYLLNTVLKAALNKSYLNEKDFIQKTTHHVWPDAHLNYFVPKGLVLTRCTATDHAPIKYQGNEYNYILEFDNAELYELLEKGTLTILD